MRGKNGAVARSGLGKKLAVYDRGQFVAERAAAQRAGRAICARCGRVGPRQVPLPEEEIIVKEDLLRVRETMDALPDRQREVLYLHACEGFSLPEIAEILALSPQAVKASLSLARKRMRQKLQDLDRVRILVGCVKRIAIM